jgi:enoyl-CoA hydratase/carnithine racemase
MRVARAAPRFPSSATRKDEAVQFWTTDRRGAVEIATFSNPPHNYLDKPVIDELEQLVVEWRDPCQHDLDPD